MLDHSEKKFVHNGKTEYHQHFTIDSIDRKPCRILTEKDWASHDSQQKISIREGAMVWLTGAAND